MKKIFIVILEERCYIGRDSIFGSFVSLFFNSFLLIVMSFVLKFGIDEGMSYALEFFIAMILGLSTFCILDELFYLYIFYKNRNNENKKV